MDPLIASKKKLPLFEDKLLSIINEGISLSKPVNIMKNYIERISDNSFKIKNQVIDLSKGKLYVMGWGKVAGFMAEAIESILGAEMIEKGVVISTSTEFDLKKIKVLKGSHPFPLQENIHFCKQVIELAKKCKENDYVICLISGGGSALLCLPVPEISLNEKMETTKVLIQSGMDVERINIVRKHLSGIKGGRLAKIIYPASIINLIISDDVKNKIYSIASGPTIADKSTFIDVLQIIEEYKLTEKLPVNVVKYLKSNLGNSDKETVKGGHIFDKTSSLVIYDNKALLENLRKVALEKGFDDIEIYPETFCGDIDKVIGKFCSFIGQVEKKSKGDFLVLGGGEVEIKTKPNGQGGRVQHFAALMIPKLQKFKNSCAFVGVASDGNDFIDGLAGAIVDDRTMDQIARKKIDYEKFILNTDTFNLHDKLGTHLFTVKPTQTNVFDIYVFGCKRSE